MKTLQLVRAVVQGTTWLSADGLRDLVRRGRLWMPALAGLGILAGAAMAVFMVLGVYRGLLSWGTANGLPDLLPFSALLGSGSFLFVTAIPLALSLLYYSSDLAMLLPMPVRSRSILAAKFFLLFLYCLPVHLVLFVPALWLQTAATGISAAAALGALLALVIYPLLPLSLAVLAALALMKAVNLSRWRTLLETIGMGIGTVLVVGLALFFSRSVMAAVTGAAGVPVSAFFGLFAGMRNALPPLAWAASAMIPGAGPLTVLFSAVTPAALAIAATAAAAAGFAADVMERSAPSRRHAALSGQAGAVRGVLRTLLGREWAILTSSSTFIFEAVGELLVLPLLLGVYGLLIPRQYLMAAMNAINGMSFLPLALTAGIALMTGLTTVSSTSLSREGRHFGISLMVPIAGRTQVSAKLLLHLLLFSPAYLLDCAIAWLLFRYPPVSLVFMIPAGLAVLVLSFCVGIYFDMKRPFLRWTHPQQAMKSNTNALLGIGGSAGVVLVTAVPCALLVLAGMDTLLVGCAAALVFSGAAALVLPRLLAFADRQYGGGLELGG
jgi:ABC-2 type transport system permease protein